MIIVVEGPDFAGKTTLVEKLKRHHEKLGKTVTVYHTRQPDENLQTPLFIQYVGQIEQALNLERAGNVVIFDRLHIGEAIYGPHYRGTSEIDERQMEVLDDLLDNAFALKVFVDTNNADLLNRFRGARGDDLVKDESSLLEIAEEYRSLLHNGTDRLEGWIHWTRAYETMFGIEGAA